MKRDMELIRKILFAIEEQYNPVDGSMLGLPIEGYQMEVIAEHCDLLFQSGLINEYNPRRADQGLMFFYIGGLTNDGFDYLETIRNEEIWTKTKEEVKDKKLPQTIEWIAKVAGKFTGAVLSEMM